MEFKAVFLSLEQKWPKLSIDREYQRVLKRYEDKVFDRSTQESCGNFESFSKKIVSNWFVLGLAVIISLSLIKILI